jgi:hypothetical protein
MMDCAPCSAAQVDRLGTVQIVVCRRGVGAGFYARGCMSSVPSLWPRPHWPGRVWGERPAKRNKKKRDIKVEWLCWHAQQGPGWYGMIARDRSRPVWAVI